MEQFKNLLQVMIWAHNRLDDNALNQMWLDIHKNLELGLITHSMEETLTRCCAMMLDDCKTKKQEAAAYASMA